MLFLNNIFLAGLFLSSLTSAAGSCNLDNVLRALNRHGGAASTFCSQFLGTTSNHATVTPPTYLSQYPMSRVSSGCSCLSTSSPIATPSSAPPTSTKTISTFVTTSLLPSKTSSVLSSLAKSTDSLMTSGTSSIPAKSLTLSSSSKASSLPSSSKLAVLSSPTLAKSSTETLETSSSPKSSKGVTSSSTSSTHTASSYIPTFTGTTIQVFSSPASCYSLPTPTSSLSLVSNNLTTSTQLNSPLNLYLDRNGTTAYYYNLIVNGTSYLYDVTNPNQIAITSANGASLVVNTTGLFIFGANCDGAIGISIANFTQQINNVSNSTLARRRRGLSKRRETSFAVDAFLEDQCGNPVTDMNPAVDVGTSPCQLQQAISGSFEWTCQFPGAKSPEQTCENSVNNALNYVTTGFGGQLTNIAGAAAVIAKFFPKSVIGSFIASVAEGIAGLAAAEFLIDALGVLALAEIAIAAVGQDNIAYGICSLIHLNDGPMVLHLITSYEDLGLGIISSAPTPTYDAGTVTISDPATTSCTCAPGVCGTFSLTYSSACGPLGDCTCATDANGNGVCVQDVHCPDSGSQCATNADCGGSSVCWINNCCGYNICVPQSYSCTPAKKISRKELTLSSGLEKRCVSAVSGALCT